LETQSELQQSLNDTKMLLAQTRVQLIETQIAATQMQQELLHYRLNAAKEDLSVLRAMSKDMSNPPDSP